MHLIYEALKKAGGKTDGEVADRRRQGHEVGKPARPGVDRSGDARHRPDDLHPPGEKVGNELVNVEFDKVENVKDPVKAAMKN